MAGKLRLDKLLVERQLALTRNKAAAMIMAAEVSVDGRMVDKPGAQVSPQAEITVKDKARYVGRGGYKLEAALAAFPLVARGKACADVGASTGGFTDCLLQHGAARVYAID
ncbi:MAG: TlyA family rRNA (cytidine-2'-O)-methyltransferase, partial [Chloroflexi bacterium]|nr:TlyA family rRNA (cytidine-2'-O)-methyltransferase [Chloroflexota bacterium]